MRRQKTISLAAIALVVLLILASCESNVIARIEFAGSGKTAEMRHITYDFSALRGREADLDASLGTLRLLKNVEAKIDTSKLLSAFNMLDAEKRSLTNEDAMEYTYDECSLVLYKNGVVSYSNSRYYGEECTLTEEQASDLVYQTVKNAGLDLTEHFLRHLERIDNMYVVAYSRTIDGVDTIGNTGIIAHIEGNNITSLHYLSTAFSGGLTTELIGVKAAIDELLTEKSSQNYGRQIGQTSSVINSVIVTSVKLVYWDSSMTQTKMKQTHIQPVYVFEGTCIARDNSRTPFTGYVRAVPDTRTTDFSVEDEK